MTPSSCHRRDRDGMIYDERIIIEYIMHYFCTQDNIDIWCATLLHIYKVSITEFGNTIFGTGKEAVEDIGAKLVNNTLVNNVSVNSQNISARTATVAAPVASGTTAAKPASASVGGGTTASIVSSNTVISSVGVNEVLNQPCLEEPYMVVKFSCSSVASSWKNSSNTASCTSSGRQLG